MKQGIHVGNGANIPATIQIWLQIKPTTEYAFGFIFSPAGFPTLRSSVHYTCDAAPVLAAYFLEGGCDGFWVADYVEPTTIIHWCVQKI